MTDAKLAMFRNRVVKNQSRLAPWRKRDDVSCYRVYDRDIPELPFAVDVYGEGDAGDRAAFFIAFAPRHGGGAAFDAFVVACADVVAEVCDVARHRVVVQARERERGGEVEADDADASAFEIVAREGRARFLLRLGARRDPGLFLDHRTTRALVANDIAGRALLNLFAYTGSFSVQAALAQASSTTSLDLSQKTCRWAEENIALNGLDGVRHRVICRDVLAYVEGDEDRGAFDVVVVDPPSFSRSKRAARDFDVARDHAWLVRRALTKCRSGGTVWFSTNLRGFRLSEELARDAAVVVVDVSAQTKPPDWKHAPHACFRITRA